MALSGVSTFDPYASEIIRASWRKAGVANPTEEQIADGWFAFNVVLKALSENEGVNLWKNEWKVKKFSAPSEVTGTDSNIYTCILSHTSSATNKPVTGDEWEKFWILRGSTGGAWATSTSYSSKGDFAPDTDVIGIDKAFIKFNNSRYELGIIDRYQYFSLSEPGREGFPTMLWLDMSGSAPSIKLDYQVTSLNYVLHYLQTVLIEDVQHITNTVNTPARFKNALIYILAADLANELPNVDEAVTRGRDLRSQARQALKEAKRGGLERHSTKFARKLY